MRKPRKNQRQPLSDKPFTSEIKRLCEQTDFHLLLTQKLAEMAIGGNLQAAKLLQERLEGKPATTVELSSTETLSDIVNRLGADDADLETDRPDFFSRN